MKSVTSTTLDRKTRSVMSASKSEPISITTRGQQTHVLISIAEYERLTGKRFQRDDVDKPT